jgi:hypothetical protein
MKVVPDRKVVSFDTSAIASPGSCQQLLLDFTHRHLHEILRAPHGEPVELHQPRGQVLRLPAKSALRRIKTSGRETFREDARPAYVQNGQKGRDASATEFPRNKKPRQDCQGVSFGDV